MSKGAGFQDDVRCCGLETSQRVDDEWRPDIMTMIPKARMGVRLLLIRSDTR